MNNDNSELDDGWMKIWNVMTKVRIIIIGSNKKLINMDNVWFSHDLNEIFYEYENNKGKIVLGWH